MSLGGKVCFVTGAARGLGKIYSEGLLQRGAKVIIIDILEEEGRQTENEFQKNYGKDNVSFYSCDITKYEDVDILYKKILEENGQIDILINNAGTAGFGMERKQVFEINLFGLINLTEMALKSMQNNNCKAGSFKGIIINISSNAGLYPIGTEDGIYNGVKHAVTGFSVSIDLFLCQTTDMSIRIYTICPAFVKTDMTKPFLENPDTLGRIVDAQGGWTNSERVAGVVMKLLESNPVEIKPGGLFYVSEEQCVHVERDMFKQVYSPFEI